MQKWASPATQLVQEQSLWRKTDSVYQTSVSSVWNLRSLLTVQFSWFVEVIWWASPCSAMNEQTHQLTNVLSVCVHLLFGTPYHRTFDSLRHFCRLNETWKLLTLVIRRPCGLCNCTHPRFGQRYLFIYLFMDWSSFIYLFSSSKDGALQMCVLLLHYYYHYKNKRINIMKATISQ